MRSSAHGRRTRRRAPGSRTQSSQLPSTRAVSFVADQLSTRRTSVCVDDHAIFVYSKDYSSSSLYCLYVVRSLNQL